MSKDNFTLIFRLLNICLAYIAILVFSSYLPHWPGIPFHTWINEAFLFSLFLLAITITLKETHNKSIFFNLSLYFLGNSLSFINAFIGSGFLFGSDQLMYQFYIYKTIFLSILFNYNIIFIVIKYLFPNTKVTFIYIITGLILTPGYLYLFHPYFDTSFVITLGVNFNTDIYQRIFLTYPLALCFTFLYGYLLYKKDRILGSYINAIMANFFIFLIINMVSALSVIYKIQIFSIHLIIQTGIYLFLFLILLKKLIFLTSEYGQFYEHLIQMKGAMGKVKIQRHKGKSNAVILNVLMMYLYHRRNYILFILFVMAFGIFFFQFPKYFSFNLIALTFCTIILGRFIIALYEKRIQKNHLI